MTPGPILLARHGQTAENAEGRFQGQEDVPLNAEGRAQAHALAEAARGHDIAELWCSPLIRARETADAVGAAIGLQPRPDARFMEADTGEWTGLLKADVERDEPELWAAYMRAGEEWRFPGGESLEEQQERVVDGLVSVTHDGALPALVVCHRGVIRVARAHTHLRGLDTFHEWEVPNAALVTL